MIEAKCNRSNGKTKKTNGDRSLFIFTFWVKAMQLYTPNLPDKGQIQILKNRQLRQTDSNILPDLYSFL